MALTTTMARSAEILKTILFLMLKSYGSKRSIEIPVPFTFHHANVFLDVAVAGFKPDLKPSAQLSFIQKNWCEYQPFGSCILQHKNFFCNKILSICKY
jgi:hypothetical protein